MIKNIHPDTHVYNVIETLKTIVEFVSEETPLDIATDLGIDFSQGYYFGESKVNAITDF